MRRLGAIPEYRRMFADAYPGIGRWRRLDQALALGAYTLERPLGHGDLDTVLMTACRPAPSERYQPVTAFAEATTITQRAEQVADFAVGFADMAWNLYMPARYPRDLKRVRQRRPP